MTGYEAPILLYGFGVTNQAVARSLVRRGRPVVVADDRGGDAMSAVAAELGLELRRPADATELDALVASAGSVVPAPGLPESHPVFEAARRLSVGIRSEFDLAREWDDRPLLSVTGTNGKTTVTMLVTSMLEHSGLVAAAVGNTDVPLVAAIDDPDVDVFVVESSSFRLAHTERFTPLAAAWLNFAEDHLDVHATLEGYEAAKARSWRDLDATSTAVANAEDPVVARHVGEGGATYVTFGVSPESAMPGVPHFTTRGSTLVTPAGETIVDADRMFRSLPHDVANALAASALALAGSGARGHRGGAAEFRGLAHRVELVGKRRRVVVRRLQGHGAACGDGGRRRLRVRGAHRRRPQQGPRPLVAGDAGAAPAWGRGHRRGRARRGRGVRAPAHGAGRLDGGRRHRGCGLGRSWRRRAAVARLRVVRLVRELRRTRRSLRRARPSTPGGDTMTAPTTRRPREAAAPRPRRDLRAKRTSVRRARKQSARAEIPMAFWVILGTVGVLCLLGLIMVLSVTTVKSTYEHDTAGYFFSRQAIFLGLGGVLMFLGFKVGHRRLAKLAKPAMAVTFVLLALVLFLGQRVNGSSRWFAIGFLNVQPSEIAKLAVIMWVARLLASRARQMDDWRQTILPVGIGLGANLLLIMLEPDLGTVVVLIFVVAVMLTVSGARLDVMAAAALPVIIVLAIAAFSGYHAARWTFLTPMKNGDTTNYQLLGSLSSVASGGWFGVGPGASMAKWGYLPEAHTDAIFAVIAEEMGVVGALTVIGTYVVLLGAGLRVARDAADAFGRLLAIGISSLIAVQAFVNIGVVLGVLPNKGFTLPFVSYGGSSLLVMLFAVGLLLSVAREGSAEKARIRRREALNRKLARRGPAKGRLVLVSGDSRPARTATPAARTAKAPARTAKAPTRTAKAPARTAKAPARTSAAASRSTKSPARASRR
ncbi:MAG: FtsW/RodA/SpoVE family cell cycle protein [Acidimicrobiales bacterium]